MAVKWYDWTPTDGNNWSTPANWEPMGAEGGDGTYPGEFDTDDQPQLSSGSGNCTLDVSPEFPLGGFLCNAGAGYDGDFAFGANSIDVDGTVIFGTRAVGSITADAGAKIYVSTNFAKLWAADGGGTDFPTNLTIEMDGTGTLGCTTVSSGSLIINTAGTITVNDNQLWGPITYTTGTLAAGAYPWTMTHSGNLDWNYAGAAGNLPSFAVADGVTCTLADNFLYCAKLIVGDGATITDGGAGYYIYIFNPVDNFISQHANGTISAKIQINTGNSRTTGSALTLEGKDLETKRATAAIVADGEINLKGGAGAAGDFDLSAGAGVAIFDMNGQNLVCKDIIVGDNAADGATLDLGSGAHTVAGGIADGALAGGTNSLDVATSDITLGGTFDGDSITVTGEAIDGGHCVIHGGTVQDVSMPLDDDALDATDEVTDGGGCENVWWSGCNGGHQIIGNGLIGSAEAA